MRIPNDRYCVRMYGSDPCGGRNSYGGCWIFHHGAPNIGRPWGRALRGIVILFYNNGYSWVWCHTSQVTFSNLFILTVRISICQGITVDRVIDWLVAESTLRVGEVSSRVPKVTDKHGSQKQP